MTETYDLIVLGGGPAGTSAAAGAGLLGKRVALVEKAAIIGGAGINTGTIPSKTLRETALVLSGWRSRRLFGVDLSLRREATVDDFMRHANHVAGAERTRIGERLDLRKVTRFVGTASFVDPHTICIVGQDGTETRLRAASMPEKLVVIGGGVIGSEYAGTFAALGVEASQRCPISAVYADVASQ